jgi:crotonobetainyl-CoA:carnitine CoA-transferase CaiB-like acyl-CoA transferase
MRDENRGMNQAALAGKRIIDLTRVVAGPFCTQMLADHGAEVIKVEPPQGDETRKLGPPFVDGTAAYFDGLNRNKLGISLDLSRTQGREALLRLLPDADVLVENFLPGTMEKWGLGYDTVLAPRFPRLVYCRISGFGTTGPLGNLPGYDAVLQAMCGLMSVNGDDASGPTRVGVPIIDLATGLSAAFGILLALSERERSGRGQLVDCSLYDTAMSLLHPHAANWFASGVTPTLTGSAHPSISPYEKFAARGAEIFLGVVNDGQFAKLCRCIGREDLLADPRFSRNGPRLEHRAQLRLELEKALAQEEAGPLCERLMAAGVPAGPVNSVPQALQQAHTLARDMVVEKDGYRGLGLAVKLGRTPGNVRRTPPRFGADTREVLRAAGVSEEQIRTLTGE